MMRNWIVSIGLIMAISGGAAAEECGEPPLDAPRLPTKSGLSAETIREARDAVVAYSSKMDRYLACMDGRAAKLFTYMTEEQRSRWDNDLADLHETRRQLQIDMNERIRAFRNAQAR